MARKIRIFFRLTIRRRDEEDEPGLPIPLGCLVVSLIWFWVRVHLGMPADTPLFHNRYWIFGDGLAMALGVGGVVFTVLWIKDVAISIADRVQRLLD